MGFADRSHLGKVEVQGAARPAPRAGDATRRRLVVPVHARARRSCSASPPTPPRCSSASRTTCATVVDLTSALAALTIAGPLAPEVFARFTAIDLRPGSTPVEGFRPGSVGRTPGAILREGEQSWLMLFGSALGSYMWTVVADAAENLGGGPVGVDALTEAAIHA